MAAPPLVAAVTVTVVVDGATAVDGFTVVDGVTVADGFTVAGRDEAMTGVGEFAMDGRAGETGPGTTGADPMTVGRCVDAPVPAPVPEVGGTGRFPAEDGPVGGRLLIADVLLLGTAGDVESLSSVPELPPRWAVPAVVDAQPTRSASVTATAETQTAATR